MQTPLFDRNRKALMTACRAPTHPEFGKSNDELEAAIVQIKAEQPECFLNDDDLKNRCFVHAPPEGREMPYRMAVRYTLCAAERAERGSWDKARRLRAEA